MKLRIFTTVLVLTFALFINSCEDKKAEKLPAAIEKELALLPEGMNLIGYLNFAKVQGSELLHPLIDSVKNELLNSEEYQEFMNETGLDIEKDIDQMLFAAKIDMDEKERTPFYLSKGTFKKDRIISFIQSKIEDDKLNPESYSGNEIYTIADKKHSFCFYDKNTFVAGSNKTIKAWIDNHKNPKTKLKEMRAIIDNLRHKNYMWFVVDAESFVKQVDDEQLKQFKQIKFLKYVSASLNLNSEVQFYGQSVLIDNEKAELLHDTIKGALAAAKLAVSEERELVDLINQVKVNHRTNTISFEFEYSKEDLDKLMKQKKLLAKNI